MRHRVGQRKLGRVTEHRIAMLRNQAEALITHEHIETTLPKAKELRPLAEKLITLAKNDSVHTRRQAFQQIPDNALISKLFDTLGPRFSTRPGGYTRILRIGYRRGDSAEVAQIELVGSEYDPNAEATQAEAKAEQKPKGVGGRLRAAAERLRGKAKVEGEEGEGAEGAPKKKAKPERTYDGKGGKTDTRGKGAKTSSPRKAGGS